MNRNPLNAAMVAALPYLPRSLVWRISQRYIAGVTLDDALARMGELNRSGVSATLDVLGEDVRDPAQVTESVALYRAALAEIAARGLDGNVSIKLSEMGLRFDEALCRQVMDELAKLAGDYGNFVRIDMEDSSVTEVTLTIYRALRQRYRHVGIVVQSCLKRTPEDVAGLLADGIAHVRLCKGIYREPETVAHVRPAAISAAYGQILEQLLEGGCEKVAIATHDPKLVTRAVALLRRTGTPRERYEFQMLLGVAERLRDELVADGHPLRVYVPFGEQWFAYSARRLRENPAIAGHVAKQLVFGR